MCGCNPWRHAKAGRTPCSYPRRSGRLRKNRPWLLFHGWRQSPAYWKPVGRWLARDQVDLIVPSIGASAAASAAPGSYERLEEMAVQLAPTRAEVILGHSAGAMLALACDLPQPPNAIVLIEPVARQLLAGIDSDEEQAGLFGDPSGAQSSNAETLYPRADVSTLAYIEAADDSPAARTAAGGQPRWEERRRRLHDRLGSAENLVVVRGARSAFCTEASASMVAEQAGNCRAVLVIRDCGHSPHVEAPRVTADALRAAVDQAVSV